MVDAVRCAVEVQSAMAERNAGRPEDQRIAFRIGINIGDIIIDGDDIFGDGVNVAARLEGDGRAGRHLHIEPRARRGARPARRSPSTMAASRRSRTSLDRFRSGAGRLARRDRPRCR